MNPYGEDDDEGIMALMGAKQSRDDAASLKRNASKAQASWLTLGQPLRYSSRLLTYPRPIR
jgi:hypothetical protein